METNDTPTRADLEAMSLDQLNREMQSVALELLGYMTYAVHERREHGPSPLGDITWAAIESYIARRDALRPVIDDKAAAILARFQDDHYADLLDKAVNDLDIEDWAVRS